MTWQVHADPILWIAGLRALLLQAVHPAAMAGVLQHSDFRADPWGRLRRTADYVGVVTFGSDEEVARMGARVRGIHRKVRGTDASTSITYRADDPHLLRWVHCCEVESFVSTYQRATGALAPEEIDAYYAEQTRAAAVVGLDPADVPSSAAEIAEYFASMRAEAAVDRRARRVASYVLLPPMPRWTRRLYGLPTPLGSDATATAALRGLHAAMRAAPDRYREGPHLKAARERLGLLATG